MEDKQIHGQASLLILENKINKIKLNIENEIHKFKLYEYLIDNTAEFQLWIKIFKKILLIKNTSAVKYGSFIGVTALSIIIHQ